MEDTDKRPDEQQSEKGGEFQRELHRPQIGFVAEMAHLAHFLLTNKRWWLLPIVLVLLLASLLVILSGTGAAPFIYTLF
jgi:hypothetical protein